MWPFLINLWQYKSTLPHGWGELWKSPTGRFHRNETSWRCQTVWSLCPYRTRKSADLETQSELQSGQSETRTFTGELKLNTFSFQLSNQYHVSDNPYLPQRRCTAALQGVLVRPGRPAWGRWELELRPESHVQQLQELRDRNDIKHQNESH